jgi:hypothetical protein
MNMEWLAGVIDCGGVPMSIELLNTRLGAMDKNKSFQLRADKEAALQRFIGFADVQAARLFEGGPTGGDKQVMTATAPGTWAPQAMAGVK